MSAGTNAAADDDDVDAEDKRICWRCIGNSFLKAKVRKTGTVDECDYCDLSGKTFSIGEIADKVGGAFKRHYVQTPIGPPDHEELIWRESDVDWRRDGEPAVYAIGEAAGLDDKPAEDVRSVLEATSGYSVDDYFENDEGEFSEESQYEEIDADAAELHRDWEFCQTSLKTETRLFNKAASIVLDSIFAGLGGYATRSRKKVIVDAGPGTRLAALYRARVFQSDDDKLKEALERPDLHLGPPPPNLASAGRMNARGIGVFYGATHADVAIAETRPPVGSRVLVGRFEIVRPLILLDVEALRSIIVKGSIFDPAHAERLKKASFLRTLSRQMTLPVMPDDGPSEYLVTQAIADYLANLTEPKLDGIIYRSVQVGKTKKNVVLFHKSAFVKPPDLPLGTEVTAQLYDHDEDGGRHINYMVWENEPAPKKEGEADFDSLPILHEFADHGGLLGTSARHAALAVDLGSLRIHHIERATYTAQVFTLDRHRYLGTGARRRKF